MSSQRRRLGSPQEAREAGSPLSLELETDVEKNLISSAVPQLILHIRLLARALPGEGHGFALPLNENTLVGEDTQPIAWDLRDENPQPQAFAEPGWQVVEAAQAA